MILAATLLSVATVPQLHARRKIGACEPRTDSSWVSDRDYPRQARDLGLQGKTRLRLGVDVKGCASDCEILVSTGFAVLDNATCTLMLKNARFKPATNEKGDPVPTDFETQIVWALPNAPVREPTNWEADAEAIYAADGALLACRSTGEGNRLAIAQFCKYALMVTPDELRASNGEAVGRYKIRLRGAGRFGEEGAALPITALAARSWADVSFVISTDGRVQRCVENLQGNLDNPCRFVFDPYSESKTVSGSLRAGRITVQFESARLDRAERDGEDAKPR